MHHKKIPNSKTSDENAFQREQINFSTQQNSQRTAARISISKRALQRKRREQTILIISFSQRVLPKL